MNRTKGTQGKRNRCSERFGGLEEPGMFGEQQDFPGRIMGCRKGVRGRKRKTETCIQQSGVNSVASVRTLRQQFFVSQHM